MNLSVHNFKTLGVFWLSTTAVRFRQNGGFKISPQLSLHEHVGNNKKNEKNIYHHHPTFYILLSF